MRYILFLLLIVINLYAKPSQEITPISQDAYKLFDIQPPFFIESTHRYKIMIAKTKLKAEKYRILYILDGNAQLPILLNTYAKNHETLNNIPIILVGIGYDTNLAYDTQQRSRDYTPPHTQNDAKEFGGAYTFLHIITSEIMPYMAKNYSIDSQYQGIFGHSYGGLFVLYSFLQTTKPFQYYFSASPSLWLNSDFVFELLEQHKNELLLRNFLANFSKCKTSLFIMSGSREKEASIRNVESKINADSLAKILHEKTSCNVRFRLFADKTHGEVIEYALLFALQTILINN